MDYQWFLLFSLIPLAVGFAGLRTDLRQRPRLLRQVKGNIASLMVFLVLIDSYLFVLS